MKSDSKVIHFDIDKYVEPFLKGEKYDFSLQDSRDNFADTAIVTIKSLSQADKNTLAHFPGLKLLITRTVGTDHIDLDYCKRKNIAVYHIIDYGAQNIAEHAMALLLSGTRRIIDSQKEIKRGVFLYKNFLGFTLQGKTLGVIGTGRIGLELIKLAKPFGVKIIAYDVYKNEKASQELQFPYTEIDELLNKSDVITLHAPLLDSTKHMINESSIQQMKDGVVLINTARGGLIDTKALIKNIRKFRYIGLDVLEDEEEFSKDHPLLQFENVVITPHIAFFTDETVKKIAQETEKCIENFRKGSREGRVV